MTDNQNRPPAWPILSAAIASAEIDAAAASCAWRAISGGGPMGLTPDSVKAGPQWKAAAARYRQAAARLASLNGLALRHYRAECRASAMARREAGRLTS